MANDQWAVLFMQYREYSLKGAAYQSRADVHGTGLRIGAVRSNLQRVSIEAIKNELRVLPAEERRKLIAFMVALEDQGRADYAAKLAQRIDDSSPGRWLTPEECERELGLSDDRK